MSEEQTPDVAEIKERLKIEVEEEATPKLEAPQTDVVAELKQLGRQFAETVNMAWNSEERQRVESEIREGVKSFVDEVDNVIREARQSKPAERIKEEAGQVKSRVETTDVSYRARSTMVQGLKWLSEELDQLAQQFTLPEKGPQDVEVEVEIEDDSQTL